MNLHYLAQRMVGRATCIMSRGARLAPSARIRNLSGRSEQIIIGENSVVRGELFVFAHGGKIVLGNWCYVGEQTRIWSATSVKIGDRVLIAHNVNIFDTRTHPLPATERHLHFKRIATEGHPNHLDLGERPVVIGHDAWIGAGAFVLRGVTIGEGAIIGAGSVVTDDVQPYWMVAGNPAQAVRQLSAQE